MGLIRAGLEAAKGVMADQWLEFFYCDEMGPDVLVRKGSKKISKGGSNKKASDNIISNGSNIAINVGQCMMIVDNGKIVEVCAEPGNFTYDTSTEPSIFSGNLGEGIKASFKQMGKRFTMGGSPAKDQRIYFFNIKEITSNKYGTPNPVPFRVVDQNIGLDIDIAIKCFGEYSYEIIDPLKFYERVCSNVTDEYLREEIDGMLKTELLTALQPAFAKISSLGIRYSAIPGHTTELSEALREILTGKWTELRGIKLVSFGVSSVSAPKEDEDMIKELQRTAVMRNTNMAAATLVSAQSDAMRAAGSNEGGAMMGFMGLGMAQQAGGMNAQNLFTMGQQNGQAAQQNQSQQNQSESNSWQCGCGARNSAKFCSECGKPNESNGWNCVCGVVNKGKFCAECGKPKPSEAPKYACDKCNWVPKDPTNPPKFCPECGDSFDQNDIR